MSDLTFAEKEKLEQLLGMKSGYVLKFRDWEFGELVQDSVGLDIFSSEFDYRSGSKANRLRALWKKQPNHIVGKLLNDLLAFCRLNPLEKGSEQLHKECRQIAERLSASPQVLDMDAIEPNTGGRSFEALTKSVRYSIYQNKPEEGLDRLHTFLFKYLRVICVEHGISTERDKPLHSLMGEYVKYLKGSGLIESQMAERILKSSISTMESFNDVRNEMSLAHDNQMLGYDESILIFNHVASAVRFIASIEEGLAQDASRGTEDEDDHLTLL